MSEIKLGPIQEEWLQSLEQNPERQGKGELGKLLEDDSYKACCLGELGIKAGVCKWSENGELRDNNGSFYSLSSSWKDLGLGGAYGEPINSDNTYVESLSTLNDKLKTWPEIAAIVRSNPSVYFSKSF